MSANQEAKQWLELMKAHTECCGTPVMRKLLAENDALLLAIANISVDSPHYSDGKFEDHSSVVARMKKYARDVLTALA